MAAASDQRIGPAVAPSPNDKTRQRKLCCKPIGVRVAHTFVRAVASQLRKALHSDRFQDARFATETDSTAARFRTADLRGSSIRSFGNGPRKTLIGSFPSLSLASSRRSKLRYSMTPLSELPGCS